MLDILTCPDCEGDYLHQVKVKSTWRDKEDGDGFCYTSKKQGHSIERLKKNEIPFRRDNLVIDFDCENCGKKELTIYQHKGSTYLEWGLENGEL